MDEVCCTWRMYYLATDAMARSTAATAQPIRRDPNGAARRPMVRPSLERIAPLAELTGQEHAAYPDELFPVLYATGGSAV